MKIANYAGALVEDVYTQACRKEARKQETIDETEKNKNRIANKGKKKITSRGDHSMTKKKRNSL